MCEVGRAQQGGRCQDGADIAALQARVAELEEENAALRSAEEALARSEERLRDIADLLPNVVCEVDTELRATYVNRAAIETSGYTEDELRRLPSVVSLFHPDDRARAADRIGRVLGGEPLAAEYRMVRKDGSEVQMLATSAPAYHEGRVVGLRVCLTDVTAYKRALRELEVGEERHRMLVDAMNEGLGVQDENGVLVEVNDRLCEMMGYARDELLGRRTIDLIDSEARDVFYREVARRKEPSRTPYEITFQRKDGTRIATLLSPAPLVDADGRFRGSFAVLTDITGRVETEEALERERHLLQTLLDSVPDSIYVKDIHSAFILANQAHLQALGVGTEEDVVGKTDFDFFPRALAEQFFAEEQGLITSGKALVARESLVVYQSGQSRWTDTIKVPLRSSSGETVGIVGITRDISKRKEAEEALRVTEESFRTILEHSRDIAYKLNVHTRTYEYVSPCVEELLGFTPDEVLEMTSRDMNARIHADDVEHVRAHRKKQLSGGGGDEASPVVEYRVKHKWGEYRWFSESSTLVRDNDELVFIVGTMRDITEQKQAENAVLTASRLEATATLAGGIAHDFNNLMVGVMGNAELLGMRMGDRPDLQRVVARIVKSAEEAGDLAQKMLAFARGGKYQPEVLDVNQSIDEALQLEEHSFPPAITLRRDFEENLWPVRADPGQLNQVVMNLSINAVESIEGGGTITITTRNLEIDSDFARMHPGLKAGCYVYLSVEDTGKGMTPEVKTKVFEPFFTTKFQGRGLGLAAVYGIVKNHNGFISVYSEPQQGTCFKVYLPALLDRGADVSRPRAQPPAATGNEVVLLVDDEDMVLTVTREILEGFGYRVLIAHDGREGIELARTHEDRIDLCILDMGMPVMGGAQAFPVLREVRPEMRVIICSGYELGPSAQALLDGGACAFVQKPFRADNIAAVVRKVLDA
ncbi:MAG TPA: PAS domain S-box protein [Candidatus Hydrogenedentes bacterium]|nr:PAS domain S-box protein [Candidatus Hydrogenedentota bacterium]